MKKQVWVYTIFMLGHRRWLYTLSLSREQLAKEIEKKVFIQYNATQNRFPTGTGNYPKQLCHIVPEKPCDLQRNPQAECDAHRKYDKTGRQG